MKQRTIAFQPWPAGSLPRLTLAPHQVDLWAVRLDVADDVVARLAVSLDEAERARAGRFIFARERRRFRVAHGALRRLLSAYRDVPPDRHRFIAGPHGKPVLVPDIGPAVQFNLTHSGELAVYAIAATLAVGVDIEELRPLPDAQALARRYFSPAEYTTMAGLPEEEQSPAFLRCWTRKEAYLKAIGEGLSRSPASVEVRFGPDEAPEVRAGRCDGAWSLYQLEPAAGYTGTLAVSGADHRCTGWVIERESMLRPAP
jgi:4'-phosphopantetheinyl transferase